MNRDSLTTNTMATLTCKTQRGPYYLQRKPKAGTVGGALQRLREMRGLSLSSLAERTGISLPTMYRLEIGATRLTLGQLVRIADAYRVKLARLAEILENEHRKEVKE